MRTSCGAAAFLFVLAGAPLALAGPLVMHPKATRLPTDQQGPFVTTADGAVLCVDGRDALLSRDEGRTWRSQPVFKEPDKFEISRERALLRTREGVVIVAFMNLREKSFAPGFKWGGPPAEFEQWILPIYVCRSLDDGQTWEPPQLLNRPWCGCIHSLIQTRSGRIVLVGQTVIPQWRHATLMFYSDDQGRSWRRSNTLDIGAGRHDHAGSCEATALERADGSLYLLLRTETGWLCESTSTDAGQTWSALQKSAVPSVTCCGQMARLADGRAALLWNRPPRHIPDSPHSREELWLAFSTDDGRTWPAAKPLAARYVASGEKSDDRRVSYPYLYERRPGELWITTMQGGLRLKINTADFERTETFPPRQLPPTSVVMFGDSTTALRPGAVKAVYAQRIEQRLLPAHAVANRGVGGNTTEHARARFDRDVLALKPKLAVIQFGINDAAVDVWKTPPAAAPRVALARYEENLRWMIEQARAAKIRVVLMTSNPLRWTEKMRAMYGKPPYDAADPEGFDKLHLRQYVAAMRKIAADANVPLVDVHAEYDDYVRRSGKPADSLLLDGVHPNDEGHGLVAQRLLPIVLKSLAESD